MSLVYNKHKTVCLLLLHDHYLQTGIEYKQMLGYVVNTTGCLPESHTSLLPSLLTKLKFYSYITYKSTSLGPILRINIEFSKPFTVTLFPLPMAD